MNKEVDDDDGGSGYGAGSTELEPGWYQNFSSLSSLFFFILFIYHGMPSGDSSSGKF